MVSIIWDAIDARCNFILYLCTLDVHEESKNDPT